MDSERTVDSQVTQMDSQAELVTQLVGLRKDLGCTPERLLRHEAVYSALRKRIAEKGTQPTVAGCIAELKKIAETLHDAGMRESLLVSLGLDDRFLGQGLTTRRANYLAIQGTSAPSERTLRRWEDDALDVVASLLSENHETKDILLKPRLDFTNSGEGAQAELETVFQSSNYYFSENGSVMHRDIVKWVKATKPGASQLIEVSARYVAENRRGVTQITPNFGCSVLTQGESDSGTTRAILKIFKQLDPADGIYPLGYRTIVNSPRRCEPLIWWDVESAIVERFEIRLIFQEGMTPARAWWFIKKSTFGGQFEPDPDAGFHLDLLDNGRYIYKMFDQVQPHWSHGISWTWKQK